MTFELQLIVWNVYGCECQIGKSDPFEVLNESRMCDLQIVISFYLSEKTAQARKLLCIATN